MSRSEDILQATLDGTEYDAPPQSRIEALLLALKDAGGGSGAQVVTAVSITKDVGDTNTVYTVQKTAQELIEAMKTSAVIGILDDGTDYTTGVKIVNITFKDVQYRAARNEYQFTSSWQTFSASALEDKPTYVINNG